MKGSVGGGAGATTADGGCAARPASEQHGGGSGEGRRVGGGRAAGAPDSPPRRRPAGRRRERARVRDTACLPAQPTRAALPLHPRGRSPPPPHGTRPRPMRGGAGFRVRAGQRSFKWMGMDGTAPRHRSRDTHGIRARPGRLLLLFSFFFLFFSVLFFPAVINRSRTVPSGGGVRGEPFPPLGTGVGDAHEEITWLIQFGLYLFAAAAAARGAAAPHTHLHHLSRANAGAPHMPPGRPPMGTLSKPRETHRPCQSHPC